MEADGTARRAAGTSRSARSSGTRRRSAGRRCTRTSRWTRSRRCTATSTAAGRSTSRTAAGCGRRTRPGCARRDWYDFRDPGQMWERNYYQAGTAHEQLIEGAVRTARRERVFDDFDPDWVDFLRKHLQVPAFIEHGIWLALASAARDTLSDTVTHCVALEAAMKQRQAQAYLLYGMDLEEQFGDFPVDRRQGELHERRRVAAGAPLRRAAARDARLGRARDRRERLLRARGRAADPARAADALGALQRRHHHAGASATSPSSNGSGCAAGRPSWCGSCSTTRSTARRTARC